MKLIVPASSAFLLVLISNFPSWADGLVRDGHVYGNHTDLILTDEQKGALKKGQAKIRLTAEQKILLKHLPKGVNVQEVSVLPKTSHTCTCELENVAVQVSPSKIEIADDLFGRDLAAEIKEEEKSRRELEDKELAKEHSSRGSKEFLLYEEASRLYYGNKTQLAIPKLEQALQINPRLNRAKRMLNEIWNNLGVDKEQKGNLKEAVTCLEKSLGYSTDSDSVLLARKNLARVRKKLGKS